LTIYDPESKKEYDTINLSELLANSLNEITEKKLNITSDNEIEFEKIAECFPNFKPQYEKELLEEFYNELLENAELAKEQINKVNKVGANAPCPCGSGKKYKRCCRDKANPINQNDSYLESTKQGGN
jgi:uncharacterized protein YecA (UPF0149 family)